MTFAEEGAGADDESRLGRDGLIGDDAERAAADDVHTVANLATVENVLVGLTGRTRDEL